MHVPRCSCIAIVDGMFVLRPQCQPLRLVTLIRLFYSVPKEDLSGSVLICLVSIMGRVTGKCPEYFVTSLCLIAFVLF